MKPMSDLCWTCQKNSNLLIKAANLPLELKTATVKYAEEHLFRATQERSLYTSKVKSCKDVFTMEGITDLEAPGNVVADCSRTFEAHYSFDFAQQIHYPYNPMQPGPIFFKTPRKIGVFGMMTEGLAKMVLFLLDEASSTGKGANCVISLLNFFFENYGLKETVCHLHADNCSGQNKNNAMMHYLAWRVIMGKHKTITLSFLLAGHTKLGPDWCFGLFKKKLKSSKVDCLKDVETVAKQSSPAGVIVPQLCGDEGGRVFTPMYSWDSFFFPGIFRKMPAIKYIHHVEFYPDGRILCKDFADSETVEHNILKVQPSEVPRELPPQMFPSGLSVDWKNDLFKEIRPFVAEQFQDLVCPRPRTDMDDVSEAVRGPGRPLKKAKGLAARK
ncbi:uncharacterized protein LOC121373797 [Gigantopelta aegis]|uniref:uncharacterized protein LOC121373797 n=1 Tax=Gigantopelta aegis TaxID=1735272 RepID=UPI001B88C6B3|nr:uncharacterized protein LOC121373797 [Gigantopelta aegis]